MKRTILFIFYHNALLLSCFTQNGIAQSNTNFQDTVLYYTNGNDSVRNILKKNGTKKQIAYYPDGKTASKQIYGSPGFRRTKCKSVKWNKEGKKVEKKKEIRKYKNGSYKDITWIIRKNGKIHIEKSESGWSDKY